MKYIHLSKFSTIQNPQKVFWLKFYCCKRSNLPLIKNIMRQMETFLAFCWRTRTINHVSVYTFSDPRWNLKKELIVLLWIGKTFAYKTKEVRHNFPWKLKPTPLNTSKAIERIPKNKSKVKMNLFLTIAKLMWNPPR